jgi:16S rRNA (uracil1498-N3)-methyltransferase
MQRFFLPDLLAAVGEDVSLAPLQHQLTRVLRVKPGAQLVLLDNQGGERLVEVISVERRDTLARVLEVRPTLAEPAVAVTLYQCALKGDKLEWVWQKATELGVSTMVPVISQRTVVRPVSGLRSKQARWDAIVREAAEQSGRGRLPTMAPACNFADLLADAPGLRLVAWEEEGESSPGLIHALTRASLPVEAVSLLIGPEGGLQSDEIAQAQAAGWQVVSLGVRILRAETAALAAVTLVMGALGEMGGASSSAAPLAIDLPPLASPQEDSSESPPARKKRAPSKGV